MIPELADTMCISQILAPRTGYSALTYAECTEAKNNGEIDVDACDNGNDYFAGAVKACGGKKANLPTMAQLGELATYVYNHDSTIGAQEDISSGITLDTEKASQFLSARGTGYDYFYVWSGQETSSNNAYGRYFGSTTTNLYGYDRRSNVLAVCVDQ